jgi:hypothetical protein
MIVWSFLLASIFFVSFIDRDDAAHIADRAMVQQRCRTDLGRRHAHSGGCFPFPV